MIALTRGSDIPHTEAVLTGHQVLLPVRARFPKHCLRPRRAISCLARDFARVVPGERFTNSRSNVQVSLGDCLGSAAAIVGAGLPFDASSR